ncbi:MAG: RsbRD N-terminal domain-containing protein [Desulfovibrionaceae bacterium]|nr:RsbRD N-terminal domain-containing protein [Desulfovibrionaceae bacterium]
MSIKNLLTEYRERIIAEWLTEVERGYPLSSSGYLRATSHPFLNPAGLRHREAVEAMLDYLRNETAREDLTCALEELMRVRAVQDSTPEAGFALIYALKHILHRICGPELEEQAKNAGLEEFLRLEKTLDGLMLLALDAYVRCRDKVAELRVEELKRRHSQIFRLAGLSG